MQIPEHVRDLGGDLLVAVEALLKSAEVIQTAYDREARKPKHDIVRRVKVIDKAAEKAVRRQIPAALKRHKRPPVELIIGKRESFFSRSGERTWVVHPLDATSGPMTDAGESVTAMMLATQREGETLWGVVLFPLTGELF